MYPSVVGKTARGTNILVCLERYNYTCIMIQAGKTTITPPEKNLDLTCTQDQWYANDPVQQRSRQPTDAHTTPVS